MGKGKPTYMNGSIGLYGHIDEHDVRFKLYIECIEETKRQVDLTYCVSDKEAVGLMVVAVSDQSAMFFSRMLMSAVSRSCF